MLGNVVFLGARDIVEAFVRTPHFLSASKSMGYMEETVCPYVTSVFTSVILLALILHLLSLHQEIQIFCAYPVFYCFTVPEVDFALNLNLD